jgi:type IV pilus assembly protein PilY1
MIRQLLRVNAPACLLGVLAVARAGADADEAWLHRAEVPDAVKPLLVLLLDTSAATARTFRAVPAYDPGRDYSALVPVAQRCGPARVYWRRGAGPPPDCAMQAGLDASGDDARRGFHCDAARAPLQRHGYFIASRAAQWHGNGRWAALVADGAGAVECRADRGRHGAMAGTWYASDDGPDPWTDDEAREIRWNRPPHADPHVFYLGNYLNYLRAALPRDEVVIADHMRRSLSDALRATDGLDAALLRFGADGDAHGGYVASAPVPSVEAATRIDALAGTTVAPAAPLAELLSEAAAWLAGGLVRFGISAGADPDAFDGFSGRYRSPFSHACRPVMLSLATAGIASGDESAAGAAATLPDFTAATGGCQEDCLAALARYVAIADLRPDLQGRQSAQVRWIAPTPPPRAVAEAAGGASIARLGEPLAYVDLIAQAHQRDAAVPAGPALSAPGLLAASATSHELAAVYTLTAPRASERWVGNLFRYRLRAAESPLIPPTVVDRDGEPAIDTATGLPFPASRSSWSDAPDASLLMGGASGRLPEAAARRVYSELVTPDIADPRNRLEPGNAVIDRARVGLGIADDESVEDVIGWLLAARPLGDPGLRAPVVVRYPARDLALAFVATHDGLLHAVDATSGVERWAWLPRTLLPRLGALMRDAQTTSRSHGIDGTLVVHRFDPDNDGRIDAAAGEHLWLMFGLGRGGDHYFALDVSEPDRPRLLWEISPAGLGGLEVRPEPVIARLAVGDTGQSAGSWVVMLAAGTGLLVLDAPTGRTLWSAAATEADLQEPGLTESMVSAPRALDLDGDGHIDRAYLLDVAGGLWRFDFRQDAPRAELATARRIARLGTGDRRFQSSPDVSVAKLGNRREIAVAAGSGRADRPRDTGAIDRAYVLFDREGTAELLEPDLHDATDRASAMPATAPGWYLRLDAHGAGEKVVGPSVTFDHVLRFQTYQPLPPSEEAPCGPPRAVHRLYARDIRTGLPANVVDRPDGEEELEIDAPGLPVDLRFAFPAPADAPCPDCRARPFGLAGARTFDPGYAGDPVKTSWRKLPPPDSR